MVHLYKILKAHGSSPSNTQVFPTLKKPSFTPRFLPQSLFPPSITVCSHITLCQCFHDTPQHGFASWTWGPGLVPSISPRMSSMDWSLFTVPTLLVPIYCSPCSLTLLSLPLGKFSSAFADSGVWGPSSRHFFSSLALVSVLFGFPILFFTALVSILSIVPQSLILHHLLLFSIQLCSFS